MAEKKYSNIIFTSFKTLDNYTWDNNYFQYYVFQHEICPKTNKEHLQGYAEFIGRHSLKKIKEIFQDSTIHIEARKGTQKQAIDYCKKTDTRKPDTTWTEFGTPKKQGERNDIRAVYDDIKNNCKLHDIVEKHTNTYAKYYKAFDHIRNILIKESSKKLRDVHVVVIWGAPGVGKSKLVWDNTDIDDTYRLKIDKGNLWFDGYQGESTLVIEEFKGQIDILYFLQLLDRYPLQLPVKGSHSYANWNRVFITSNFHPDDWYNLNEDQMAALNRRFTHIHHLETESAGSA